MIKHTLDYDANAPCGESFGYSDHDSVLKPAPATHHVDFTILDVLQTTKAVRVPKVLRYFEKIRTTVMTDFQAEGFHLMQDLVVTGALPMSSAENVAKSLVALMDQFRRMSHLIRVAESSTLQARERLEELYTFLRSDLKTYQEIERKFLSGDSIVPTDAHPKNMAINAQGEILMFDFGRSIVADKQYSAPNFAAHIGLASVANCFEDPLFGAEYIATFVSAYNRFSSPDDQIEEATFVRYFMSELLHRGLSGRWLDKRFFSHATLQEVERAVHDLAIETFRPDEGGALATLGDLLNVLTDVSRAVGIKSYKGRRKTTQG